MSRDHRFIRFLKFNEEKEAIFLASLTPAPTLMVPCSEKLGCRKSKFGRIFLSNYHAESTKLPEELTHSMLILTAICSVATWRFINNRRKRFPCLCR